MTDAQKVAEGLSEAQREAITEGKWNVMPTSYELIALGLVTRFAPYMVELSPAGKEVRAILQEKAGG